MPEHKSITLRDLAIEHGWESTVVPDTSSFDGNPDTIIWKVYARRSIEPDMQETLLVQYKGDLQTSATYRYGDLRLIPARRAGVVKLLTGKPDPRKFLKTIVSGKQEPLRIVPFDLDSPALTILKGVLNKKITWVRKVDSEERSEDVPETNRVSKHFRVIESPPHSGRRILEFTNRTGFHAVALDQIVDVS